MADMFEYIFLHVKCTCTTMLNLWTINIVPIIER